MPEPDPAVSPSFGAPLRDAVSDALAYWEPRRILYNAVLVAVVLVYFAINWPYSRGVISLEGGLFAFILAVLANVCYCAAYLGDVFVQVSGFRQSWHRWRWVLFLVGMAFAAVITRWFAIGFFTPPRAS